MMSATYDQRVILSCAEAYSTPSQLFLEMLECFTSPKFSSVPLETKTLMKGVTQLSKESLKLFQRQDLSLKVF